MSAPSRDPGGRLAALDQFRGYTVAGMFLVNFLGGFAVCPRIWRHTNDYCSYADTIMPHFFFAVGFTLRLGFLKQRDRGQPTAWGRVIRRVAGLALLAIVWYGFGELAEIRQRLPTEGLAAVLAWLFKGPLFQTLLHIAVTSLWILPVVPASATLRIAWGVLSAGLHLGLSYAFYFDWVHQPPESIDGGPLGFLTWSIPTLAGTLACDWSRADPGPPRLRPYLASGLALGLLGWGLSCLTTVYDVPPTQRPAPQQQYATHPVIPTAVELREGRLRLAEPPFVPPPDAGRRKHNYWMMSQQHGTPSYLVFSAGLSLVVFAAFVWLAERQGVQIGVFRTLGVNALAGYIAHSLVAGFVNDWLKLQSDSEWWRVYGGLLLYFVSVYAVLRLMELRRILIRL